jgi:hypothetical protein
MSIGEQYENFILDYIPDKCPVCDSGVKLLYC